MKLTRRDLAAAGALALGAATVFESAAANAEGGDEPGVKQAVEALRQATLAQDKAKLEQLAAGELSYGHSSGVVQNKAEFIDGVMNRKGAVKSIEFPELKVGMAGNNAVARHLWVSESEMDGKPTSTKIGILSVWTKQDGNWKLLARQGYKLAT
ncbi:MAG: nuclear transport factor 2 family protein [Alphaproteobacteria bacterium]|nr:nuclear transport factor 2 family protein [Alphaproteobacteria bacterium]MBV9015468.1 nuclear transport factor 2 family protein [Alphaproteobacteria bacterium]MBV9583799.1 nuclear transport factor 2 family protein [Alphaproteobacteria bacterium]MBV9965465.1 nuclear transport factor 2 family protein [Alphaproteobacteria bacterium]